MDSKIQMKKKEDKKMFIIRYVLLGAVISYIVCAFYVKSLIKEYNEKIDLVNKLHDNTKVTYEQRYTGMKNYYTSIIDLKEERNDELIHQINDMQKIIDNNSKLIPVGDFEATAYDLSVDSCGKKKGEKGYGITSSGRSLVGHSRASAKTIATDPKVIPTGSKVYVEFVDKRFEHMNGIYLAGDTGSAIKGNIIDVFMGDFDTLRTSNEVWEFGRRQVRIYKIK